MPIRVYIDGAVRLPEDAKVSVFDRGFLYGDSVYETIGTSYGRLFAARDHLDRLDRSASRIGLRVPPREQIVSAIAETMAAAGNPESRVRVILTRGEGKLDLDPASATDSRLVVIVFPLGPPTPEMFEKGVAVAIFPGTASLVIACRTCRDGATMRPSRDARAARDRATGTCPRAHPGRARRWNRCDRRHRPRARMRSCLAAHACR